MRGKGTHFFCFIQISAVKIAEIGKKYPKCVQNTAPYQAEQHRRKIAPLRTKQNSIVARLYHFVPLEAISQRPTFVLLVGVAALFGCCTTLYHREQASSQYPISINKGSAPNDAGPFPLQRVINLKFSHSFVLALHRCSVAVKNSLFYGSKIVLYLYIYLYI